MGQRDIGNCSCEFHLGHLEYVCIYFPFTYKVLGITRTGVGTIDKEGNLSLEGFICSHKELKDIKGLVPIYLEAGLPE